jgi:hypothetical protein
MSVQYHDPRAAPLNPPEPYELKADLSQALTVGLLANGFPDSAVFLDAVETALRAELPNAEFRHYDKGNASIPAPEELLERIVSECEVVVSAYGH